MKNILILIIGISFFISCKKDDVTDCQNCDIVVYNNLPRKEMYRVTYEMWKINNSRYYSYSGNDPHFYGSVFFSGWSSPNDNYCYYLSRAIQSNNSPGWFIRKECK